MKPIKILFLTLFVLIQSVYAGEWLNLQKKHGLIDNYVKKLLIYNRELWIGTPSGVSVYNLKNKKWRSYHKGNVLPDNFVTDIFIDEYYIWISTVKGVARFDKKRKKWSVFTKKNGLSDNFVNSIYADKENYWFGTRYWGVSVFSKSTKSWSVYTSIDGLAGNKVNCISGIGDEIWFGTKNGISQLKYYEFLWKIFTSANTGFGLARDGVISLTIDEDDIWCGTEGEGICKFNTYTEKWEQFNTGNKLLDDFILSITKDGEYIWVGTFGGVSLFNKYKNTWEHFGERKELPELSITSIAVDGDYIWFGSAGGGITRYKKNKPQIKINYSGSGYAGKNLIKFFGTVYDYNGIKKINISYRRRNQNVWNDKGIKIFEHNNILNNFIAQWNTKGLTDGEYVVKIDAFDNKGDFNSAEAIFKIDTIKPIIYLDEYHKYNKFLSAEKVNITGTYFEDNLMKIILNPGKRTASIDKLLKTFSIPVSLKKGENKFQIQAFDIALQNTTIPFMIIKDTLPPVIKILNKKKSVSSVFLNLKGRFNEKNIDSVLIQPYNICADIDYKKQTFSKTIKLKQGKNIITCIAKDQAGNKGSVKIVIKYTPQRDPVVFKNYSRFSSKKEITLNGNVIFKNIVNITATLNNKNIPLNFNKNKFKLKIKLKLKEGKNYLSLNAVNKNDKSFLLVKEIICDITPPVIKFNKLPSYVKKKVIKINGFYIDENIKNIKISSMPQTKIKIVPATRRFFATLKIFQKETKLKFIVSDKAGNKNEYQTNIIFDNTTPKFTSIDYPHYYNSKQVSIKGRFIEKNPDRIELNGKIVKIDKTKFQGTAILEDEDNEIKLIFYDKVGLTASTNIKIILDEDKPGFKLDDIPDVVDKNVIQIKGKLKSEDVETVIGRPGNKKFNIQNEQFSGVLKLQNGDNQVEIKVYDWAGNVSKYVKNVYCKAGDEKKIKKGMIVLSKEEYERLQKRKLIVQSAPAIKKKEFERIKLPDNVSLVMAPYFVSSGDSLWELSKSYYGTSLFADYIQKFNELIQPSDIKLKEKIFMPTLKLINQISKDDNESYMKILSLITLIRYDYGYFSDMRKYNKYLKILLNNYGFKYKKIFSNYNETIYFINDKILLILSRYRTDINNARNFDLNLRLNNLDILQIENYKNRIACNFISNYSFKK